MIEYTLIRARRRTVALYVRAYGVEVRAPLKMPQREIDEFVESLSARIAKKTEALCARAARRAAFRLDYGGTVPFRGEACAIVATAGRACFDAGRFCVPRGLPPEQIKAVCVRLYRILAKRHLSERVAVYAARMGVAPPASIRISGARGRWGSCSAKGNISFSWRLMMADDEAIDYVVVHELAHLTEMNHSARFWAIVERVFPDRRARKARLRALWRELECEDWEPAEPSDGRKAAPHGETRTAHGRRE